MKKTTRSQNQKMGQGRRILFPGSLIILFVAFLALLSGALEVKESMSSVIGNEDLSQFWEEKDYDRIIELTEQRLLEFPLDTVSLIYCGFSYFYKAASQVSEEKTIPLLDHSIFLLRTAIVIKNVPMASRIDYVLGKAYLMKGQYYADLSVFHLGRSVEAGYINDDSYEYLGSAYSLMDDYDNSLTFFLKALEKRSSDQLYLKISQDFIGKGMYDEGERYLSLMIDSTRDELLKKKGLFQLANLYYDMKNYKPSEEALLKLIDLDTSNEDYYFLLGELYFYTGENKRARSMWYKTTRINPKHVGALKRLYD